MDLKSYDLVALKQAVHHLNKVEQQAIKDRAANPGPGWEPVFAMLERDRDLLYEEIASREAASNL